MDTENIEVGDIVQIVAPTHSWYPAILLVSEVKSWGVLAYVIIPISNVDAASYKIAPIRLPFDVIEKVGVAKVILI
jgi:hypothetical protein